MTNDAPDLFWIRKEIQATNGYSVDPAPEGIIKLDAMENPFGLPAVVRERLAQEISKLSLNRYPDGGARDLKKALAAVLDIPVDHLFLGNGSDEILLNLFLATAGAILLAEPTFSMYRIIAGVAGRKVVSTTLSADLTLDMASLMRVASRESPSLIVLSHPNNPTGLGLDMEEVRTLCRDFAGGILIDEAYYPFSRETLLPLQEDFPNLMILRTVSKMGLAGLRLGILAAAPSIVGELDKVRLPYNMDAVTQKAALVICQEFFPLLEEQTESIIRLRESFTKDLKNLPGVIPIPSKANFLLLRLPTADPSRIHRLLQNHQILVRDVSHHHPLLSDCLRVTVGTEEENAHFVSTLERILKGQS